MFNTAAILEFNMATTLDIQK